MAKNKKEQVDLNNQETKQLLLDYVGSIQKLDNAISQLRDERKDTLKRANDLGFNKKLINKVISDIRKKQKADPLELSEEEIYEIIISESGIVEVV